MTNLQQNLITICNHLGLQCNCPHKLDLGNAIVVALAFLPQLGGKKGMLVFSRFEDMLGNHEFIGKLGYGWSVLDDSDKIYDTDQLLGWIEIFSDWGWNINYGTPPDWLVTVD